MPERIHKELVVPNHTNYLVKVREIVMESAAHATSDSREIGRIILAVDEALSNIIEHAYKECGERSEISIIIDADPTRFEVLIVDSGKEFDPSNIPVPDVREHVREGKKGGLGIFLMRQIMDEVKYTFVQGLRNELRMIKYFRNQGGQDECQT